MYSQDRNILVIKKQQENIIFKIYNILNLRFFLSFFQIFSMRPNLISEK